MSFNSLPLAPESRAALESMGITEPTPIQAQALPVLFSGHDLIGQARTGSGKTLAFALPMVQKVDPTVRAVQAVVLVPTRELAQQVADVVDKLTGARIRCVRIFGGKAMGPQITAIKSGPPILVGTPGRVLDLLRQQALQLDQVRYFVLDEADEMLDRGFAPDVERILGFASKERQTVLFSATVPEWVNGTAQKHLRNPQMVTVDPAPEDAPKIDHVIYDVPEGQKLPVLRVLLDGRGDDSVLVFGRTKHGVKKLARQLAALGYPAAALQGNLSQNARDAVMADFRSGVMPILLATNVAARGLDVENIGLVINYELPETTELLTHRVGRTGRMGREGDAVTLLMPSDEDKWRQLSRLLKVRIPRKPWTGDLPAIPEHIQAFPMYPKPERPAAAPRAQGPRPAARPQAASSSRRDGERRDNTLNRDPMPNRNNAPSRNNPAPAFATRPVRPAASSQPNPEAWGPAASAGPSNGNRSSRGPWNGGAPRADRPNRFDRLPQGPRNPVERAPKSGGSFFDTLAKMDNDDHTDQTTNRPQNTAPNGSETPRGDNNGQPRSSNRRGGRRFSNNNFRQASA